MEEFIKQMLDICKEHGVCPEVYQIEIVKGRWANSPTVIITLNHDCRWREGRSQDPVEAVQLAIEGFKKGTVQPSL